MKCGRFFCGRKTKAGRQASVRGLARGLQSSALPTDSQTQTSGLRQETSQGLSEALETAMPMLGQLVPGPSL